MLILLISTQSIYVVTQFSQRHVVFYLFRYCNVGVSMDFKDLTIIKEIYETKNITKAANNLFISQPTLTYHLQKLEKDLGISIMTRQPKGVVFSENGLLLAHFAQKTLQDWMHLKKEFVLTSTSSSTPLKIGLSTVISKLKFPRLFQQYTHMHKEFKPLLYTGSSTLELPKLLYTKEIDIAIVRGNLTWEGPQILLKEEPYYLISNSPIQLENLLKSTWICYQSSYITKTDLQLRQWWNGYFTHHTPKTMLLNSIEAAIEMVKHNLGWTIIPEIYLTHCSTLHATPIAIRNEQPITRKTILAYQPYIETHKEAQMFIHYIKKYYK